MSELEFDERGNLVAGKIYEIDLTEFSSVFTTSLDDYSNRLELFNRFVGYLSELTPNTKHGFYVWVNGSFVSKKPNPEDIDFVVF